MSVVEAFQHNTKQPDRGVIVVDTGFLFGLYPNIGVPCKDGKGPRYMALLPFLAENGYKIIIPEMVAMEAGEVLANGKNMYAYFAHGKHRFSPDRMRYLSDFLVDIVNHPENHPNIILESEDMSDHKKVGSVSNYLYGLHQILDAAKTPPKREAFDHKARSAIQGYRDLHYKSHLGDVAIWRTLKRMEKTGVPIFVLSDDTRFMKTLANREEFPNLNFVTNNGLIHALVQSGLNHYMTDLETATDAYVVNEHRHTDLEQTEIDAAMDCDVITAEVFWDKHCVPKYIKGPMYDSFKEQVDYLKQHSKPKRSAIELLPPPEPWVHLTELQPLPSQPEPPPPKIWGQTVLPNSVVDNTVDRRLRG